MNRWRTQMMAKVLDAWENEQLPLTFETYISLMSQFPRNGCMDVATPGQDDEGDIAKEGEMMWVDDAGCASPRFPSDDEK